MTQDQGLKRKLGFWLLTIYGVGVMVGAGIYVLIGQVAGETGTWAPIAFILAGVIAAPTAVSYAELATRIPESAGEAAYVRAATGSGTMAAIAGIAVAIVGVVSAAAVLQGGIGYLRTLVDLPVLTSIVMIGVFLGCAAILGVIESLVLAAALTIIEVVGLLIVVFAGATGPTVELPATGIPISGLAAASLLAFFAFIGFEDMVNMAEETKDPQRTMPRAIISALAVTTILYVLVSWAAVRTVEGSELAASEGPLALVFERATGKGAGFLAIIAVAAALNGVLAQIVMAARVLYGLGRFSPPFRVFHHAHPRFRTPVLATAVVAVLVILLAAVAPLVALAEATSIVLLVVFCVVNLALIILKSAGPQPGFSVPLAVPVLGFVLSAGALIWGIAA